MQFILHHERCSGCRACLLACSVANFREITTARAALRIEPRFPAPGDYRIHMCDHCGACAEACPEEAIERKEDRYVLREEACSACGTCIEICPNEVLGANPETDLPILCTGCGECAAICPRDAIEIAGEDLQEVNA
ncbi:MAG: 4Fe-4S binding protein [Deltaproteobacteria bacterium]|nr:4Fe-4S binding protein [Deltaproteobacteria bacterium]